MSQSRSGLGSARVSRAGDGVSPSRTFKKIVLARRQNQRARRARSPGACILAMLLLSAPLHSRAQDAASSVLPNAETETQGIVVSATRIETPINEIGSSVPPIPSWEIERSQR